MNRVKKRQEKVSSGLVVQDFARYEFKYILSNRVRQQIESEIVHFMKYDGHVHKELNNSYYVCSLYFDSSTNEYYYEKIDGIKYRRKYRIRTYGHQSEVGLPIFFEERVRGNNRTYKHRIPIKFEDIPRFCDSERIIELREVFPEVDLVERFIFDSLRCRLVPKVKVDYIRRPYTSDFDMNFRLTFDNELHSTHTGKLFVNKSVNMIKLSLAGHTILEVKFNRRIPVWFHRILQKNNMQRISISKFCVAMETTNQVVNLS